MLGPCPAGLGGPSCAWVVKPGSWETMLSGLGLRFLVLLETLGAVGGGGVVRKTLVGFGAGAAAAMPPRGVPQLDLPILEAAWGSEGPGAALLEAALALGG